jgi:hypothetical protein
LDFQRIYRDVEEVSKKVQQVVATIPVWEEPAEDISSYMPLAGIYAIKNKEMAKSLKAELILYGIFVLKIPVDTFPTEKEYLLEIARKCEELLPLEKRRDSLQQLALKINTMDPTFVTSRQVVIFRMFGISYVVKNPETGESMMSPTFLQEAFERIELEIKILDEKIALQKIQAQKAVTSQSILSKPAKILLAVASVAAAIAIGGFFLYRRKSAK